MSFDVFISYSRTDVRLARSLHVALERLDVPIEAAGVGSRLNVFRDETDIRGTRYYSSIDSTLRSSRKLVVVCSPAARGSTFVNDEIARFLAHHPLDDVIPVIASGLPNNATDSEARKAFPDALGDTPLAADLSTFEPRRNRLQDREWEVAWHLILANVLDLPRSVLDERSTRIRDEASGAEALRLLDVATNRAVQGRGEEALLHLATAHAIAPRSVLRSSLHLATISAFPEFVVEGVLQLPVRPQACVLDDDGSVAITWAGDNVARMIDATTGEVLAEHAHPDVLWRGVFLDDGSAATFSRDGRVAVLRRSGEVITWEARSPVWDLLRYPDGDVFASIAVRGYVCLWTPGRDEPLVIVDALVRNDGPAPMATFASDKSSLLVTDGSNVVTVGADAQASLVTSDRAIRVHEANRHFGVFLLSDDRALSILHLDPATGAVADVPVAFGEAPVKVATIDSRLERLAYLDTSGRLVVKALQSEAEADARGLSADVDTLAWSNGNTVVIASGRETVSAVAAPTGEVLWTRSFDRQGLWGAAVHDGVGLISQIDLRGSRATLIDVASGENIDTGQSVVRPVQAVASASAAPRLALVTGEAILRILGRRRRRASVPIRSYDEVANVIDHGGRILLGFERDDVGYAVLDAVSGEFAFPPLGVAGPFSAVLLSPKGNVLLARGRDDSVIRLWRREREEAVALAIPRELYVPDVRVSVSEDGNIIAASADGPVAVVDLEARSVAWMSHVSDHGYVQLQLGPRAERLAALSAEYEIDLWNVADGQPVGAGARFDGPVYGLGFIADGEWLIAWSADGSFVVIDSTTGAVTRIVHSTGGLLETGVNALRASSDGALLFSAGQDGTLKTWDRETAEEVAEAVRHSFSLRGLAPSDDAERILAWGGDTVTGWHPWSGTKAGPDVVLEEIVASAWWTLDNEHSAISDGRSIRLYDVETGTAVAGPWHHHGADVAARFVDDVLVTWTTDGSAAVWKVDPTGPVEDWRPFAERVTGHAINVDRQAVEPLTHDEHAALPDESVSALLACVYAPW